MSNGRKPPSKRMRFRVLKRDAFTCQYCGRSAPGVVLHVDHRTPSCAGGSNDIQNLVTACEDCNLGKATMDADAVSEIIRRDDIIERIFWDDIDGLYRDHRGDAASFLAILLDIVDASVCMDDIDREKERHAEAMH